MRFSSRRSFLKQSILSCSSIPLLTQCSCLRAADPSPTASEENAECCEKKGCKMRFGLVTYLWGQDWDLPTVITNCEKSGILGVELRVDHKHDVKPSMTPEQRKEVRKRFKDTPVIFVGMGTNEQYDNPDPAKVAQAIENTKAFVKLSYDCGGSGVKVKPNQFHPNVPKEKTLEQIGKSLNIVGKYAADFKQQIRLEVHGTCAPLPYIKQIMDVADHPNVTVCWNSNDEDLQGEGLEKNFAMVSKRFGDTAHVRELNIGKYPYQKLMDLFVGIDYKGWILLEARTAPKDPVAAMIEQKQVFDKMVADAQSRIS
ncbi:MAG: TIM barrel protein [Phycisphaerae bacterium]|nr:TIM barrel protein [Phycisphaerae bacterium]